MEKINKDNQEEPITKEEALNQIMAIRQEVYMMGANDFEFSAIDEIVKNLESEEISPQEAVSRVYKIKEGKSDYH